MEDINLKCSYCDYHLTPVKFEEIERVVVNGSLINTGRKRIAVSHLICGRCGHSECVDDSLDGNWY